MAKISWKAGTMLSPLPPAMISCGSVEAPNVLTVAWTGIIASDPVITYISIRPERYSHQIIKESGEFVINLPNLAMLTAVDFCGVRSGKNTDKFKETGLHAIACSEVSAPQIEEAPVSLECKVKSITNYGTHDMFLAEVAAVNIDDKYLNKEGKLCLEKAGLLAFSHGTYFTLGRELGTMGFSVNKKRLAQMEKMKQVEVSVKQPKLIKEEKPKEEVKEKPKKKYGKPLGDRPRGERSERPQRERKFEDKPRGERSFGDKPRNGKPFGDKPRREGEGSERPRGGKRFEDKPRGERSFGDRPHGGKPFGDKPRGERPRGDRPKNDRPFKRQERGGKR